MPDVAAANVDEVAAAFLQFRDFWAEVELVAAALSRGDLDVPAARARLRSVLEAQQVAQERSAAPALGPDASREAQYVMVAAADDLFIQQNTGGRDWTMQPLELDLFGTRCAGQRVFERIEALLTSDNPDLPELAGIYLTALALGFKGMYADQPGGEHEIADYRDRLRAHIADIHLDGPLVPQNYRHTTELTPVGVLASARAWWWAAVAIAGVWLVVSSLLWLQLSGATS